MMAQRRAKIVIRATILSPSKGVLKLSFVALKTINTTEITVNIMVNFFIIMPIQKAL
jgi:hypothetical protein